ncbi:MAG: hypothetical protein IJJ83_06990 [Muribaculaceae bacterium]|nr:hypothetical protein [Muribaculaceae bacterium]
MLKNDNPNIPHEECGSGKTCKYFLCPIPSNQITLSKGGTSQNPGW